MPSRTSSSYLPSRQRPARSTLTASAMATMLTLALAGAGVGPVSADEPVGTSDAGIVPIVIDGGSGGNVICADIGDTLASSDRLEWRGNRLRGDVPDGLEVSIVGTGPGKPSDDDSWTSVTWTSTFPITAVIVKGGSAANVYVYAPALIADSGLVAPVGPNGQPADVSNVTFCWDPDPTDPPVDLVQVCMSAAMSADVGPIVSAAGPIEIRDGSVVLSSVPEGLLITYDAVSDQVGFIAPFPVVVVVTATSEHRIHHIVPPATSGTVPLSSNPGHGDMVLCGLDTEVVASASCADIGSDLHLGPIRVRNGAIDPAELPEGITSMEMDDGELRFTSTMSIAGVLVTASPSELHTFDEPVLTGSIPMMIDEETDVEIMFCALRLAVVTDRGTNPASESTVLAAQDPVLIATGGGPPVRTPLALLAFVLLGLTGSTTMLLWTRGG